MQPPPISSISLAEVVTPKPVLQPTFKAVKKMGATTKPAMVKPTPKAGVPSIPKAATPRKQVPASPPPKTAVPKATPAPPATPPAPAKSAAAKATTGAGGDPRPLVVVDRGGLQFKTYDPSSLLASAFALVATGG